MNLLLLTPQPPLPAHQGTAIRNWGILRHVAPHHAVTLLSFAPAGYSTPPPELAAACHSIRLVPAPVRGLATRLRTAAGGRPDLAERLWSMAFDQALREVLAETHFDLAQVEGLELGRYISTLRALQSGLPVIYDAHNAEVTIQQRAWRSDRLIPRRWLAAAYSRLQMRPLARFEAAVCRQDSAVTCVSVIDAQALTRLVPGLQPTVVPNGIELSEYPLPETRPAGDAVLTFTGKMDYRPNVDAAQWFASEILPRVQAHRPDARFEIVGQQPPSTLARYTGVTLAGAVPDIRPHIARAAVYVAPLRMGGGTRFKLLEAMALGRPVVSTTIGAEGFAVRSGQELLIADATDEFARAVLQLLDAPSEARAVGLAGRAFVEAGYDWAAIIPRLEALQQQVGKSAPVPR